MGEAKYRLEQLAEALDGWTLDDLKTARRLLPDVQDVQTVNTLTNVYFIAGLLACREYLAQKTEDDGAGEVGILIRAVWWPQFGEDPGLPREFDFDEIAQEIQAPDGQPAWQHKDISAAFESLPRALQGLLAMGGRDPVENAEAIAQAAEAVAAEKAEGGSDA